MKDSIEKVKKVLKDSQTEYKNRTFQSKNIEREFLYNFLFSKCKEIENAPDQITAQKITLDLLSYIENIQFYDKNAGIKNIAGMLKELKLPTLEQRNLFASDSTVLPQKSFNLASYSKSSVLKLFVQRKHLDETLVEIYQELSKSLPLWTDNYQDKLAKESNTLTLEAMENYKLIGITDPDTNSCYADFNRHLVLNDTSYIDS